MEPSHQSFQAKPPRFSWVNVFALGVPYGIIMSAVHAYGVLGLTVTPFNLADFSFYVLAFGGGLEAIRYFQRRKAFNKANTR